MRDSNLVKEFGKRVKKIRKQKRWTQKELANKIGIRYPQLNKYECGLHQPPFEVLIKMAEALDTTLDYLINGNQYDKDSLHDTRLHDRFRALQNFCNDDKEAVIRLLDAFIVKSRVEGAIKFP